MPLNAGAAKSHKTLVRIVRFGYLFQYIAPGGRCSIMIFHFFTDSLVASEEALREKKINPLQLQHQKENKSLSVKCITF